jgi:hypothetical protein
MPGDKGLDAKTHSSYPIDFWAHDAGRPIAHIASTYRVSCDRYDTL